MMKHLLRPLSITAVALMCCTTISQAQSGNNQPDAPVKTPALRNINLSLDIPGNQDSRSWTGLGINYQWHKKGWAVWQVGLFYASSDDVVSSRFAPVSKDTIALLKTTETYRMEGIGCQMQAQRSFYRKIFIVGGVDLRCGYGVGTGMLQTEKQIVSAYRYNETVSNKSTAASVPDIIYVGMRPHAGLRLNLTRVMLGAETGIWINNEFSTGGFSFNMNPLRPEIRLLAGYNF